MSWGDRRSLNKSFLQLLTLSYSLDLRALDLIIQYSCTDTLKPGPGFEKNTGTETTYEIRAIKTEDD